MVVVAGAAGNQTNYAFGISAIPKTSAETAILFNLCAIASCSLLFGAL